MLASKEHLGKRRVRCAGFHQQRDPAFEPVFGLVHVPKFMQLPPPLQSLLDEHRASRFGGVQLHVDGNAVSSQFPVELR
jgi:hypothetical protein